MLLLDLLCLRAPGGGHAPRGAKTPQVSQKRHCVSYIARKSRHGNRLCPGQRDGSGLAQAAGRGVRGIPPAFPAAPARTNRMSLLRRLTQAGPRNRTSASYRRNEAVQAVVLTYQYDIFIFPVFRTNGQTARPVPGHAVTPMTQGSTAAPKGHPPGRGQRPAMTVRRRSGRSRKAPARDRWPENDTTAPRCAEKTGACGVDTRNVSCFSPAMSFFGHFSAPAAADRPDDTGPHGSGLFRTGRGEECQGRKTEAPQRGVTCQARIGN